VAILASAALSGCGTVFDTFRMSPYGETCRVYGGVRVDADQAQACLGRAFGPRPDAWGWDMVRAAGLAADMLPSAVADTLLLPVTVPRGRSRPAPPPVERVEPATGGGPANR
jgi:uncharacterized protein YceK